jgi:hypothetical protein
MIAPRAVVLGLLGLAACAQPVPSPFAVAETELEVGRMVRGAAVSESLPAIEVRRSDGAALLRDDWVVAEAAASAHCADAGATYERLPPARDYTQIRLDDGVFYFMARCLR